MTHSRYNGPILLRVDRLKRLYWPRDVLGMYRLQPVLAALPCPEFTSETNRSDAYHYGRVRYFYDRILEGEAVDPIVVLVFGREDIRADVHDGHHRYAAHVLARAKWIPALVEGPLTSVRWMAGVVTRGESVP